MKVDSIKSYALNIIGKVGILILIFLVLLAMGDWSTSFEFKSSDGTKKVFMSGYTYLPRIHKDCDEVFSLKVNRLQDNQEIDMCQFAARPLLIVNTASYCGYTSQYKELEELASKYKYKIEVLGIPSNDFGGQEPKSDKEIADFCFNTFGVQFPMLAKASVKGEQAHPIYKWLKEKSGVEPSWNFNKFVVVNGKITHFESGVSPLSPEIIKALGIKEIKG